MAVQSIPVGGSLRVTYTNNLANLRFGGVNPTIDAVSTLALVRAVNDLQNATLADVYLTAEHELKV